MDQVLDWVIDQLHERDVWMMIASTLIALGISWAFYRKNDRDMRRWAEKTLRAIAAGDHFFVDIDKKGNQISGFRGTVELSGTSGGSASGTKISQSSSEETPVTRQSGPD